MIIVRLRRNELKTFEPRENLKKSPYCRIRSFASCACAIISLRDANVRYRYPHPGTGTKQGPILIAAPKATNCITQEGNPFVYCSWFAPQK